MNEYQALDLAQSTFGNLLAAYAVFLSLVSGYLITAYMVGSELTRVQVLLLTVLFLCVVAILIWSISAYAYWGDTFAALAREGSRDMSIMSPKSWTAAFLAVVNVFTTLGCVFFMWNVRRRAGRAEQK